MYRDQKLKVALLSSLVLGLVPKDLQKLVHDSQDEQHISCVNLKKINRYAYAQASSPIFFQTRYVSRKALVPCNFASCQKKNWAYVHA